MTPQTYANHRKYVPAYHYYTFTALVAVLAWAVYRAIRDFSLDRVMMVVLVLVLAAACSWARLFALGAQNRIIRLEERLRLAGVVPEPLRSRIAELRTSQLIGLRFASDGEVVALTTKVLDENITDADRIKQLIKDWRPDDARL